MTCEAWTFWLYFQAVVEAMKDLAQAPSSRGIEKLDTLICVEYTRGITE